MRTINKQTITRAVSKLCIQANTLLRDDVLIALKKAKAKETNQKASRILNAIIDNAKYAKKESLAICQDTGMPVVFVEIGQNVRIMGDLRQAINRGIELGYKRGFLRNSIVRDPLFRRGVKYSPAVIHTDLVKGNSLKLTVLPKGFGCENKSKVRMFKPTAGLKEIKAFILDVVKNAGPSACPPFVVGVGIGGTQDYVCLLAKKALIKKAACYRLRATGYIYKLERELLRKINKLNIGPMGLGGRTTALAVNIETYPTHIAGLPVGVNISCHALRSATRII